MNFTKRAEQTGFDLFTSDFMGTFGSGQTGLGFAEIEPWEVGEERRKRQQTEARRERERRESEARQQKERARRDQEDADRKRREQKREYKQEQRGRWEDPYTVLNIKYGCTDKEIRAAWAALVKQHHPDRGGNIVEIQRINRAYEALKKRS